MDHKMFILTAILILAPAVFTPAQVISYGEPDGTTHPNVGSIVVQTTGGTLYQFYTCALISPDVVLTAAHCTESLDEIVAGNPGYQVLVTFDPVITSDSTFYTGIWHTNPDYNNFVGKHGRADPGDIAVIILDQAPGITPASLPTAGLLDELKARHVLYGTHFTAVGYDSKSC